MPRRARADRGDRADEERCVTQVSPYAVSAQRKLRGVRDRARHPARASRSSPGATSSRTRSTTRSTRSSTRPTRAPTSRSRRAPRARPTAATCPPFSERYLDRVRRVDGVEAAEGGIFSLGRFVDEKGDPLEQQLRSRVHQLHLARAVRDAHLHRGPAPGELRRGLDRRVHRGSRGTRHRRHPPHRRPGRGQGVPDRRASSGSATPRAAGPAPPSSRCPRPSASPTSRASSTASRSRPRPA